MRPPPPPPSLHSDSQQLRSAMWNLRPRLPVVHQQPPALHDLLQRPSQSLVLNSVMPPPPPPTSVEPTAPPHLLKCSQQRMVSPASIFTRSRDVLFCALVIRFKHPREWCFGRAIEVLVGLLAQLKGALFNALRHPLKRVVLINCTLWLLSHADADTPADD